jgi:membrane protein
VPPTPREDRGANGRSVRTGRAAAERLTGRIEPTVLGRLWSRLLEVEFVDRAVALAAKAFVCFFPLLIIVTALSPESIRANVLESLTDRFGISGEPFELVRQAFATADQTRTASGMFGVLTTVLFGVAFTSSLQRTYLRAWRRPGGGGARNKVGEPSGWPASSLC